MSARKKEKLETPEKESQQCQEKGELTEQRVNIRCRQCFIVDGYKPGEEKCRHCGAKLYRLDAV